MKVEKNESSLKLSCFETSHEIIKYSGNFIHNVKDSIFKLFDKS